LAESLSTEQLRQLARHGAAARIQELESETAVRFPTSPEAPGADGRRQARRRPQERETAAGAARCPPRLGGPSANE
jgi:hypothetical protein